MMNLSDNSDSEERFVQLFARNERQLRIFVRSMGLDWTAVDDVIQTVSLVMWRKWDEFEVGEDPEVDFLKWGRVIARFEVLKFRRKMARDRHVIDEDLMKKLAEATEASDANGNDHYREALAECLKKLPEKSNAMISAAYQGDRTIRELAGDIGKSATALYKVLDRIRKSLQSCIEARISATEGRGA